MTVLALVSLAAAGCGSDATSQSQEGPEANEPKVKEKTGSTAVEQGESIHDCLSAFAIPIATDPQNISFFKKAMKAGNVVEIGSAYDPLEDVLVRLFAPRHRGAGAWMLWRSQPSSSSISLEDIVRLRADYYTLDEADPRKTHTRYLERNFVYIEFTPNLAFRKLLRRCVRFPLAAA
jgi:hypothetical protein